MLAGAPRGGGVKEGAAGLVDPSRTTFFKKKFGRVWLCQVGPNSVSVAPGRSANWLAAAGGEKKVLAGPPWGRVPSGYLGLRKEP